MVLRPKAPIIVPKDEVLIICPYVVEAMQPDRHITLREETSKVVYDLGGRFANCTGDEWAYWGYLKELWNQDETLVIIEQDMVPTPEQVQELIDCPQPFCSIPYQIGYRELAEGLGLAKFAPDLMRRLPNLLDEPCRWGVLDSEIERRLREKQVYRHAHEGVVRHLNPHQSREGL